jgi:hypothetical protein
MVLKELIDHDSEVLTYVSQTLPFNFSRRKSWKERSKERENDTFLLLNQQENELEERLAEGLFPRRHTSKVGIKVEREASQ